VSTAVAAVVANLSAEREVEGLHAWGLKLDFELVFRYARRRRMS
jgi:hypothetical protein